MGKAKITLCLLTATGVGLQLYHPHFISISNDSSPVFPSFPEKVHTAIHGVIRSARSVSVITVNAVDYKYSLHKLPVGSEEYSRELSEVHLRSAKRILKLCEANKGFYVKAGQFVSALRQVPKEYSSTLSSLQDQAVPCHFKAIQEVLMHNLKHDFQEIFLSVDEHPIAAASIAQVHRAVLKDFQEVAIKVQYPGLKQQMKLDITTMSFLSKSVAWFLPEYRFDWLVSEFVKAISVELDFVQEGRNSEKCASNFRNNRLVKVPRVFWDLTTNQVLTMQFHKGHKVDDVLYLKERGIDPIKVSKALVEVFAEMIFVHGFVHGDPHPGNILVSPEGQNGFSLVLLDHGVYKQLDEEFRLNYCQLWKALILLDSNKIQLLGERFGVSKYSKYFPVIFTGRTINSKSGLGRGMSTEEKINLKQELKSLRMEDVSSFMESLPPGFFTILRIDGLLRSNINKLGAPQKMRLLAYAKYAIHGLSPRLKSQYDYSVKTMFYGLLTNLSYLKLKFILGMLDLLSWLTKVRNCVHNKHTG